MTAREFNRFPTQGTLYPLSCRAVHRILAAAFIALTFVACGGNDSEPPPAETPAADANGCVATEAPAPRDVKATEPAEKELDAAKIYVAAIRTNCGEFEITLDAERAPKTAASFKSLADQQFYDGTTFHRIVPGFVIQGGDPNGNGTGGPGYSVEEKPPEDLKYDIGVVAMAKAGDEAAGTSGSQFFVVTGPQAAELPPDYALLGQVTGGTPVVEKIGAIITDPRTDQPEAPVVIESIRVSES
jgi:cyclophilin family peptidyl-prolyl cis-trans isomerase